jgi:hypothetical protein
VCLFTAWPPLLPALVGSCSERASSLLRAARFTKISHDSAAAGSDAATFAFLSRSLADKSLGPKVKKLQRFTPWFPFWACILASDPAVSFTSMQAGDGPVGFLRNPLLVYQSREIGLVQV